jgi:hypothetical protein
MLTLSFDMSSRAAARSAKSVLIAEGFSAVVLEDLVGEAPVISIDLDVDAVAEVTRLVRSIDSGAWPARDRWLST